MAGTLWDDPNRQVLNLPPIWTGAPDDGPEPTGATAGTPGTWTPAGAGPAANLADLAAGRPNVVVASPATQWTSGQYVQTSVPGPAGRATWSGTAWVGGVAPLVEIDVVHSTIPEVEAWVDDHPDLADEVLDIERARGASARTTLIDWLEGFIASRDD